MTSESFRKDIAKKLSDLQANTDEDASIPFPCDLTSSDRKYIHSIAQSFNLPTNSLGVGAERHIVVYKTAPEGHVARRPVTERSSHIQPVDLTPTMRQQLATTAGEAPECDGRIALAKIRPVGKSRAVKRAAPIAAGEVVEGYWPDDETWLDATVAEAYEDGSFRIVWTQDESESDVPADYVRRTADADGSPEMSMEHLNKSLDKRRALPAYAKFLKKEELPGFKQREEVVEAVRTSQVVLLSGETGCGKSTQVPQHIIDACPGAKVLCMQPRKLAAMTLAQRIAEERCEPLGKSVGHDVPFGVKGVHARLIFCTLGVFRRKLLNDPELTGITHVVFDEVHERDKLADFNMIFMRDLLARRSDLRLVLMSATLQMETFERYFQGAVKLAIPGRVFPVSELYMDEVVATLYKQPVFRTWLGPGILCGGIDIPAGAEGSWNEREWKIIVFKHTSPTDRESLWGLKEKGIGPQMLHNSGISKAKLLDGLRKHDVLQQSGLEFDFPIIEALLLHIDRMYREQQKNKKEGDEDKPPGTVLVFLPGWGDIDRLRKSLAASFDSKKFKLLALHSQVSPEEQNEIFQPAEPGVRKIVLTTNIAEASITVEGTEFVIDCGRAKEVSYDPYLKVGTLTSSWISQASAKQRAGRAGRTQGGLCFHLMCRDRFDKLDEFLPPELLRSPLEDSALTAKLMLMQMGSRELVSSFLMKAPDPPEQIAVDNSLALLTELGAFTTGEQLTALGEHLTKSPLPPRLAKTVLWSILFGCLDDALSVVAAASGNTRDPFRTAGKPREEAKELKQKLAEPHNSDHALYKNAMNGYSDASNQQAFCDKWCLHGPTMRQIRDNQSKLFAELKENKSEGFANRNRGNYDLLMAVLAAGIYPNIAQRRGSSEDFEAQGGKVQARVHGSSSYAPTQPDEWVIFQELGQMEANYRIKLISPVGPLPLLLLGGEGPLTVEQEGKGGKGGKWGKGGGGGGGTTVSLLSGWLKFRTDAKTAEQLQTTRRALQSAFQGFVQRPDHVPSAEWLNVLDNTAALISGASSGGGGVKRSADSQPPGQPAHQAPRLATGGWTSPKGSKGGFAGKGGSNKGGGGVSFVKGGGKPQKGGWKGKKY